jgi:hypothetical protein
MASGSYAKKPAPQPPLEIQSKVPPRATRQLIAAATEENQDTETSVSSTRRTLSRALQEQHSAKTTISLQSISTRPIATFRQTRILEEEPVHFLKKHKIWMFPLIVAMVMAVIFTSVLLSASIWQRPGGPQLISYSGGQVYNIQVGGNLANTWQPSKPLPPIHPLPAHPGPYSVLGKPTLTPAFINRVLAAYGSPAVGKGQALYDLGVKYQVDPAFALAFFMHESTFGTAGEARTTKSLGNLRCIPDAACVDQDRGGYAAFPTWEAGFEAWYKLIRNLYVAQWGLTTIDQIIPKYAPTADHNDENAYISSLKHELDTWHSGQLTP